MITCPMKKNNDVKVALAMIVKGDDAEADCLKTCLDSVALFVDGIFITRTHRKGEEPNQRVKDVAEFYGATVSEYEWDNHFANARNFNFAQVTKDYDYILWLDADDILEGGEKLKPTLQENFGVDAVTLWYVYARDRWDNPVVVHKKTQIVRNDGCVKWRSALHEDFEATRKLDRKHLDGVTRVHNSNEDRHTVNAKRNEEIAMEQISTDPDDPRSYWNAGNSLKSVGKLDEAIEKFTVFLDLSKSDDEKYIVRLRLAEIYWQKDEKDEALDVLRYNRYEAELSRRVHSGGAILLPHRTLC